MENSLLMDWKFWSFVVAALALVLSQLPPINILLRKAKLDLDLYSRVSINHKIGNPTLMAHLIIRNVGGRKLRINSISINIIRDKKIIAALPAQNYLPDPKDAQGVLLTRFSLQPDEDWSYTVNFLNYFNREEEKKYKIAEKKLKDRIIELRKPLEKEQIVEIVKAEAECCAPFFDFFNDKFIWKEGEYCIEINIATETPKTNLSKSFKFILFESQSEELSSYMNDINTGAGAYWCSTDHTGLSLPIEEVG